MLIPIQCFGCGKVLAHLEKRFLESIREGKCIMQCLEEFQTKWKHPERDVHTTLRLCCSRTLLGNVKLISYFQTVEWVRQLAP